MFWYIYTIMLLNYKIQYMGYGTTWNISTR